MLAQQKLNFPHCFTFFWIERNELAGKTTGDNLHNSSTNCTQKLMVYQLLFSTAFELIEVADFSEHERVVFKYNIVGLENKVL